MSETKPIKRKRPAIEVVEGGRTVARTSICSREELVAALAGADVGEDRVRILVDQLYASAASGNDTTAKYILEQVFGSGKEVVISDRAFVERTVRVTARHLKGEAFEQWLGDLTAALGSSFPT
jgi:hypothetical protein